MTSCSTRGLGARLSVSVGMSCIRASRLPFFLRMDADCSRAALSITSKRLIPFPRRQSNAVWLQIPRTFRACRFRKVRFVHIDGVATEDRLGDNGLQPPSRLV